MKRFLMRWYLLNKRLFKKPVFVLILCMVPILILALNAVTARSDGFVKIVLAAEDPSDDLTGSIAQSLLDSSDIVEFSICASPEEAAELVRYGEADSAWIFSDDIRSALADLVQGRKGNPCVTVIEREETVALRLAREKLTAALSSESGFALMCRAYAEKISPDYDVDELRAYFDEAVGLEEIFDFKYSSGEMIDDSDASYLMLPIRGVLATAVLLCGFAMAMFWIRDEEKMVFCRLSRAARPAFELGYHLTGIIDIAAVVLVSLYAAGLGTAFLRELISLLVYCLGCAALVIFIRRILRRAGSVAAVTPMIIVAVIVINPILFNLPFVYPLRLLTPVFYYLQATHDAAFIGYGLLYFAVLAVTDYVLYRIAERYDLRAS